MIPKCFYFYNMNILNLIHCKRKIILKLNIKDIEVYYEIHGSGTPFLLLHGWGPDHRVMKGCIEPIFKLKNFNIKRIYLDLPGWGITKAKPWINGTDKMLEFLLQFIDEIIPNEQFLLAGQSFGGYLSCAIVKKRIKDVFGLLLICPRVKNEREIELPDHKILEKDERFLATLSKEDRDNFTTFHAVQNEEICQIKSALQLILSSKYPVIIAGGGINLSNAHQELSELIELLKIPVVYTLKGKGSVDDKNLYTLGMIGMHGRYRANFAISEADLIIAIGCRFSDRITGKLNQFPGQPDAKIIHIDIDPAEIGKNVPVDIPIVADAKKAIHEMNLEIKNLQENTSGFISHSWWVK